MKQAPYTLPEAEVLCKDHQYLLGGSFLQGSDLKIECITLAPFDEIDRERFLILYFLLNNAEAALRDEYDGNAYTVLVIARSTKDEHELQQEDLATWLIKNERLAVAEH